MHIHAWGTTPEPDQLIKNMEAAGIWGGCVISSRPVNKSGENGLSIEERIREALAWCKGYEERLFPILWIHPHEPNLMENLQKAVDSGICGFKMICNNYYVYDDACMEVLRAIAKLNVPVLFHSGILWDGTDSSKYNRPIHWEALSSVEGLRFSLGHCSWPWIDECYAVYGQFLNASEKHPTEMFFDTTPGTPVIYRDELFTKLYCGGYDTGHNIMFGSDCFAHDYKPEWTKKWLEIDGKLMTKLGVSKENIENYYYNNMMRFLGKLPPVKHTIPVPDNAGGWKASNPEVPKIIEKWYHKLNFPKRFDAEFYRALREIPISDSITAKNYDYECNDGRRNLLSFLFMCENLEKHYQEKGLDETLLLETLKVLMTCIVI